MTLWLLAIVLWTFIASLGTQQGAIRMLISLAGVLVAAAASFKFDHLLRPFVPMAGIYHPAWYWFLPPLVVFFAVVVVFGMIAQAVHHQAEMRFKYKDRRGGADLAWDRLNSRLGTCVGLIAGTVYLLVLCQMATVGGYFVAQLKTDGERPLLQRWMNALREDTQNSGLGRLLGAMDPTPAAVYDAADTLGVLQHDPDMLPCVADYPFFLGLAERHEFQDIATDADLQKVLQQPEQISTIFTNAKVQAVIKSEDILKHLLKLEPKDLLGYLQTGASAKYTNAILGRWELDVAVTVAQARRDYAQASLTGLQRLQDALARQFAGTTLVATTEEQVFIKSRMPDLPQFAQLMAPRPLAVQPPRPPPGQNQRKGKRPPPAQPPPPPEAPALAPTPQTVAQGSWKKDGESFSLALQGGAGELAGTASVAGDGKLRVMVNKQTLVFSKP